MVIRSDKAFHEFFSHGKMALETFSMVLIAPMISLEVNVELIDRRMLKIRRENLHTIISLI